MPSVWQANPIALRPMAEHDLPMLHDWLNRPHIVEWWGGERARPTLKQVYARYLPRVLGHERVTPYIAMLDEVPIGYAQSYVALGSGDGWWEEETDPGVRGIDQSIADPELLGKGLGTLLVRALVEKLFSDPEVSKVQTDPAPNNLRAIRCYQKAGFRIVREIVTPDGPAIYMLQDRPGSDRNGSGRADRRKVAVRSIQGVRCWQSLTVAWVATCPWSQEHFPARAELCRL